MDVFEESGATGSSGDPGTKIVGEFQHVRGERYLPGNMLHTASYQRAVLRMALFDL